MLRRFPFVVLLASSLCSATSLAAPGQAPPAAPPAKSFDYTEFPSIPQEAVLENKFAETLGETCEKAAGAPAAPAFPGVDTAALTKAKSVDLTKAASGDNAAVNQVGALAAGVDGACKKLMASPPQQLTEEELASLRKARDQPQISQITKRWAAAGYDPNKLRDAINAEAGQQQSDVVSTTSPVGALSDQIIRGMAEFIQKRTQQEALRYLRTHLKKQLCEGSDGDAEVRAELFKNTCAALDSLQDGASLEAVGSYMRAAAEADLARLPDVALAYGAYRDQNLELVAFPARLGITYFKAMKSGRAPLEVLSSIGALPEQACEVATCYWSARPVRLAAAVAYALRQGGPDWQKSVPKEGAKRLPAYGVGVALLAEARLIAKAGKVPWQGFTPQQLQRAATAPLGLLRSATTLASQWKELQVALQDDEISSDQRRGLLLGAISNGATTVSEMVQAIQIFDTGAASPSTTATARQLQVLMSVALDLSEKRHAEAIVRLLRELKDSHVATKLGNEWSKLLPLIVEIGTAKSSSEVAAAFDAYASPLGTYELKFKKPMLAINGLLGGFIGWEQTNDKGLSGSAGSKGMFAPVGLHGTVPVAEHVHLGVLLSVLDLGAITSFRSGDKPKGGLDSASDADKREEVAIESAPQVGFDQVFSPGAYLTIAPIKDAPVVAGFGVSMSPKLRRVTQGETKEDVSVLRYGFFIAADVPVFPLN